MINSMNTEYAWDEVVDVIIVGFGAAGACAAIEAAEQGLEVMVLERFNGGGATKNSGGIIYAGGGTTTQQEAGVEDSPENMYKYLKVEVKDAVGDDTLRKFCEQNPGMIQWLENRGVQFEPTLYPNKTSYPPNRYHLYYSGNELIPPYAHKATPAPRGHRPKGKGLSGAVLFNALKSSALMEGVKVRYQSKAERLILDQQGRVIGLSYNSLDKSQITRFLHQVLSKFVYQLRYVSLIFPELNSVFTSLFNVLEGFGRTRHVLSRRGVILAAGGFIYNQEMVKRYAPAFLPGTPLGSLGDDGSGIRMGEQAGGVSNQLTRITAWRFITPPEAFAKGVLVDAAGERICNEEVYGAQIGEKIVEGHGGKAWLILDHALWQTSFHETLAGGVQWFQTMLGLINLFMNRKAANSIEKLAKRSGIDALKLIATIEQYNQCYRSHEADLMEKSEKNRYPISEPPFYAIDCSLNSRIFPCTTISLGGLTVDETTSHVKRVDGTIIPGLYAVGRNAAGIPSNGYVSGLSISHCIFSGRQAGCHIASESTE